jgi:hypothetical protein
MIQIGQRVRFVPEYMKCKPFSYEERRTAKVTGTVVYINQAHRYFVAEFDCGNTKQREAFKFYYIGKTVRVCG